MTHFAREPRIGVPIFGEFFALRIPFQSPAHAYGNRAQVANRCGTMSNLDVADRRFARAKAIEKVTHVIVADGKALRAGRQWLRKQVRVAGLDPPSRYENRAVAAEEFDAVMGAPRVEDLAIPSVGGSAAATLSHTVGVRVIPSSTVKVSGFSR